MKNIYNLITDAFVRMGDDESKYRVRVDFIDSGLRSYTITIKDDSNVELARVVLLLDPSDQLLEYYTENNFFDEWDRFCDLFESQL